MRTVE